MKAILTIEIQADESIIKNCNIEPVDFIKNHLQICCDRGKTIICPKDMPEPQATEEIIQNARIVTAIATQYKR